MKAMKVRDNKIDFEVRISPNEVVHRIAETSDLRRIALFSSGGKPFTYTVSGNQINIKKRRTYRNDFSSSLTLKVVPTIYGSRLYGKFSAGIVPIIFLIGWLTIVGGLSLISIAGLFRQIAASEASIDNSFSNFIPIFMFIGGLGVFFFARSLAKGEEREIADWLDNLFADSIMKH